MNRTRTVAAAVRKVGRDRIRRQGARAMARYVDATPIATIGLFYIIDNLLSDNALYAVTLYCIMRFVCSIALCFFHKTGCGGEEGAQAQGRGGPHRD